MVPTIFTAIVFAAGFLCSATGALYLQIVLTLLGAASALDLPALGGSSVNPAVMFLPFMLLRGALERPSALSFKRPSKAGFLMMMFAAWGALSAAVLPSALYGVTQVMAIQRIPFDHGVYLGPLRPVSGNITQPIYQIGYAFCFVGMVALLARPRRLHDFCGAALLLTLLNNLAGIINLAEGAGLPHILQYVRTAGYAQFDVVEGSMVRIQGTLSETSWYSTFTLPLFAFSLNLWIGKVRTNYSGMMALISLTLLLMSTSGTAYVGLGAYLPLFVCTLLWRARKTGRVPRVEILLIIALLVVVVLCSLFVFETKVAERLTAFFEHTVGGKMSSDSGIERAGWNKQSWTNFLETYGLGIGLGTARASSLVMALLGNVGVIGTGLYVWFLAVVLRRPNPTLPPSDTAIVLASQHAVISAILCAATSGTTPDMGIAFYCFAAAASYNPLRQVVARGTARSAVQAPAQVPSF